jgi:hypothetical protein
MSARADLAPTRQVNIPPPRDHGTLLCQWRLRTLVRS